MGNRSFFNALHDREGDSMRGAGRPGAGGTCPAAEHSTGLAGGTACVLGGASACPGRCDLQWNLKSAGQRIFVERFGAAPQLVVCGGGHVGASVVRLAKLLGLPVTALEDRPEFAEELRQAGADTVLCLPFAEGLAQIPGGQRHTLWS